MFEPVVGATCPVRTLVCLSSEEARVGESQIRAYKLGKQRWSYNQYELLLMLEDTHSPNKQPLPLSVAQAVLIKESETAASFNDQADSQPGSSSSKVSYRVQLSNGTHVITSFYLVYPEPSSILAQQSCDAAGPETTEYSWTLVTRDHCKKGCKGPLLHPLRRLGVLGSRFNGPSARKADSSGKQYKQSKYMYFAIDEACTHVGSKAFRLIVAVHDDTGSKLLGTTCSQPIRVIANNDIPQGAAHISLLATIRGNWDDQQPFSLRRPSVCLWPNTRLQQTFPETQCEVSVCYSAGLALAATGACCPKAAELPLQPGICTADYSSTNGCKDQLRTVTGLAESSRSGNEGLHCTGLHRDALLCNPDDAVTKPESQLAQQEDKGAHQDPAKKAAELGEMDKQEHQAEFDPADTLLWQLESEPIPLSPVALWDTELIGTQSGVHPLSCHKSFCGEYSDLHERTPSPVVNWDRDLRDQTYTGNMSVHHPSSELPSSRPQYSQQNSSTHGDPDDSHTQGMLHMTGNSCKRARCMHPMADCGSGVRSSSLPSHLAPYHMPSPWRKRMRRGFLCPVSTSCAEGVGSGTCVPEERQASTRSSLGTCIAQLEDRLELRTSELRQQRAVTSVLDAQLVTQQQEIQWLRNRVCQLQHGQYIRKSVAARTSTC